MFYERLKQLRNELGITQDDLAIKLNISRTTYANWEANRAEPNIDMLIRLANFFGVSIDYICGKTNVRDAIYEEPELCEYINRCVLIYDDFFKNRD